jgi:hypothetical protein
MNKKARHMMRAVMESAKSANISAAPMERYERCKTLILYGWGGAMQQNAIRQHNGHYVAFDLGYWERPGLELRKWRVSIDGFHCPDLIMKGPTPSASRYLQSDIIVNQDRRKSGPVLLIGNAPKSVNAIAGNWAAKKSREIKGAFPDSKLLYRPKPRRALERGVRYDGLATGPIDQEIRRAALVVCRHSNVAVDACRLGVPVVCDDGAGAAIYPRRLEDWERQPTFSAREEFLQRLAWWQWSIKDMQAGTFWPWLEGKLASL